MVNVSVQLLYWDICLIEKVYARHIHKGNLNIFVPMCISLVSINSTGTTYDCFNCIFLLCLHEAPSYFQFVSAFFSVTPTSQSGVSFVLLFVHLEVDPEETSFLSGMEKPAMLRTSLTSWPLTPMSKPDDECSDGEMFTSNNQTVDSRGWMEGRG